MERTRTEIADRVRARLSREHGKPDAGAWVAEATQVPGDNDSLERLTDVVWETLEVVSPHGIERDTLAAIAANLGVPLEVLLGADSDLVPNLSNSEAESAGDLVAAPTSPNGTQLDFAEAVVAGGAHASDADLSKLALLSTAPHTDQAGTTSVSETFRSALRNLAANRTRGLLTMLGIIIGVFSVVVLQAVGNGLIVYVNDITGDYGGNNVTIQPARMVSGGMDTGTLKRSLSLADAEALAEPGAVPDALAVSPQVHARGLLHVGDANFATTAIGVWPDYLTVGGYTLTAGAFISSEDVTDRTFVIVLGANPVRALFGDSNPIGQTVWLDGTALRVSGVLAARESLLSGGDDNVYLPLSTAVDRVFGGPPSTSDGSKALDSIVIRARSSTAIGAAQNEATELLTTRHQLGGSSPDFVASSLISALQQRAQILAAMNAFMVVVAGISLLVGGIGIMNIMLVSVAERTREIGLRKAIGARSRDILNQFLMEAMLISLVGAGIGVAGASLLVLLISVLWRPSPPSVLGTAAAILAALATGLFFGVSPARRAAELQPIEALRAE